MHEASLHKENCFITLTFNPDNLPSDRGLHVEYFQKYMKRLRKRIAKEKKKSGSIIVASMGANPSI